MAIIITDNLEILQFAKSKCAYVITDEERNLYDRIINLLIKMGLVQSHQGFEFLLRAVSMVVLTTGIKSSTLYKLLSAEFSKNGNTLRNDMNKAIIAAWKVQECSDNRITLFPMYPTSAPSVNNFIMTLALHIKYSV